MRIDVHAHYFPESLVKLLVKLGRSDIAFIGGQSSDFAPRLAELDATHTDCQILSAVGLDIQVPNRDDSVKVARYINDVYKEVYEAHGGRFRAFGWIPLPFVTEAIAEVRRCLDDLGFVGIAMPCAYANRTLDDPEFEGLWVELSNRAAVVYIHPVGMQSACHWGLKDYGLHTAYGSPLQLALTAHRLVWSGLTQRHARIRFIFAVLGGYLPFFWPRILRNVRRGLEDSAVEAVGPNFFSWMKKLPIDPKDPMAEFRRFYYDTSTQDMPLALLCAKQAFGTSQILLGSDEIFASLREAVTYIEQSEYLTPEEKSAILDRNAQALLHLPERTPGKTRASA